MPSISPSKKRPLPEDPHIPYENLGRYLAQEVDPEERNAIELHLADCPACRQDLSDAEAWQAHLATLPVPPTPTSTFHKLLIAFILALVGVLGAFLYWRFR